MFVSKKKYLALEKEFRDWKEGRKKTLFEQAGIYPPETIETLTEENRLLHQNNINLSEELEKYKKLYSDEVFKTVVPMEDVGEKIYKELLGDIILKYCDILKDHEENIRGHFVRQRICEYEDTLYVHTMIDGKVALCEKIKEA